jgi:hypothetical protein
VYPDVFKSKIGMAKQNKETKQTWQQLMCPSLDFFKKIMIHIYVYIIYIIICYIIYIKEYVANEQSAVDFTAMLVFYKYYVSM